jgi:hypothetical protein
MSIDKGILKAVGGFLKIKFLTAYSCDVPCIARGLDPRDDLRISIT